MCIRDRSVCVCVCVCVSKSVPSRLFLYHKKAVLRRILTRFRLGVGVCPLKANHLQYTDRSQGIYACPFCKDTDETEINFLYECPQYKTFRETYMLEKFCLCAFAFKMSILLGRFYHLQSLFPSKAFKLRSSEVT